MEETKNFLEKYTEDGFYIIPKDLIEYAKVLDLDDGEIRIINLICNYPIGKTLSFPLFTPAERKRVLSIKSIRKKGYLSMFKIERTNNIIKINCSLAGLYKKLEEIRKGKELKIKRKRKRKERDYYTLPIDLIDYADKLGLNEKDIYIINIIMRHSLGEAINFSKHLKKIGKSSPSTTQEWLNSLRNKGYLITTKQKNGLVCDISELFYLIFEIERKRMETEEENEKLLKEYIGELDNE